MRCFRVADSRFPLFDSTGARLHGARWNSPGRGVIYAASTYAGAILEVLVHANLGRIPTTHAFIEIEVPNDVTVERLPGSDLPDWSNPNQVASREFGDRWLAELRSVLLSVPSLVTQGREENLLINPAHAQFNRIISTSPEPVIWDSRLFHR